MSGGRIRKPPLHPLDLGPCYGVPLGFKGTTELLLCRSDGVGVTERSTLDTQAVLYVTEYIPEPPRLGEPVTALVPGYALGCERYEVPLLVSRLFPQEHGIRVSVVGKAPLSRRSPRGIASILLDRLVGQGDPQGVRAAILLYPLVRDGCSVRADRLLKPHPIHLLQAELLLPWRREVKGCIRPSLHRVQESGSRPRREKAEPYRAAGEFVGGVREPCPVSRPLRLLPTLLDLLPCRRHSGGHLRSEVPSHAEVRERVRALGKVLRNLSPHAADHILELSRTTPEDPPDAAALSRRLDSRPRCSRGPPEGIRQSRLLGDELGRGAQCPERRVHRVAEKFADLPSGAPENVARLEFLLSRLNHLSLLSNICLCGPVLFELPGKPRLPRGGLLFDKPCLFPRQVRLLLFAC